MRGGFNLGPVGVRRKTPGGRRDRPGDEGRAVEPADRVIFCAAPVSESMLPNKTPKPNINKVAPSVLPMPLLIDFIMPDKTMPLQMPTNKVAIIKEIKAFNFTTVISSSSTIIDAQRMSIGAILCKLHSLIKISYLWGANLALLYCMPSS